MATEGEAEDLEEIGAEEEVVMGVVVMVVTTGAETEVDSVEAAGVTEVSGGNVGYEFCFYENNLEFHFKRNLK